MFQPPLPPHPAVVEPTPAIVVQLPSEQSPEPSVSTTPHTVTNATLLPIIATPPEQPFAPEFSTSIPTTSASTTSTPNPNATTTNNQTTLPEFEAVNTQAQDLVVSNPVVADAAAPDFVIPQAAPTQLRVQTRDGQQQDFELAPQATPVEVITPSEEEIPDPEEMIPGEELPSTTPSNPEAGVLIPVTPADLPTSLPTNPPAIAPQADDILEITADRQDYDERRKIVTATGNVLVRFARGVFSADRVRVNLINRVMVGNGNAAMRRGQQVFRGEEFEYQLTQDSGTISQASGVIDQNTVGTDGVIKSPSAETAPGLPERPVSDRVAAQSPITRVTPTDGFTFTFGSSFSAAGFPLNRPGGGGEIDRMRFEADTVVFNSQGWQATNARITNDPFSPPELEIQADTATFERVGPLVDVLKLKRSRVVFDQGPSLPFLNRLVFDRRPQRAGLFNIGFDDADRDGLYIERRYTLFQNDWVTWTVTPQVLVQRALFEDSILDPSALGLNSRLDARFDRVTTLEANASLPGLDLNNLEDRLRASVRLRRSVGDLRKPHTLTGEYSYRDRLFNGSLGFQTVQSTFGLVLTSPNYVLGDSGLNFRYQGGVQVITADTDRLELLDTVRDNNRVSLTRYQAATSLNRGFRLWSGKPLPPTPTEGLRYTSRPVQPYLQLGTSLGGVTSHYSSGDRQQSISGSVGIQGQVGHFSKPVLDYTAFNLSYSQTIFDAQSPFLFDRVADSKVLSFGITQQIYGPFRFGFQSAINLDTGSDISTRYTLEYSRRTHSILLQYFPAQELGSFLIRIGDFNWSGYDEPFGGAGVRPVVQGVVAE